MFVKISQVVPNRIKKFIHDYSGKAMLKIDYRLVVTPRE